MKYVLIGILCNILVVLKAGYSHADALGCTSTTTQHKSTGNSATIQFQARTVNTENAALFVTNQILSHNDSTLFTAIYKNSVNTVTSACNGCTFTGNADTGELAIRLDNLQTASGGTYKHSITEASRNVEGCVNVYILGVPEKATIQADRNNVNTGESIKLICSSKSTTNPRDPNLSLQYEWRVDNSENPTDTRYVYSQSRNTMTINNVGRQDAHRRFTCKATEKGLAVTGLTSADSDDYMINVLYGPDSSTTTLSPPDTSYSREENSNIGDITCTADCNPECRYKWTKPDDTVISNNGVLSLGSVSRNDAGTYTCTVTDPNTAKSVRKSVTVNVLYSPVMTISGHENQISYIGDNVLLACHVDSNPPSTLRWHNQYDIIKESYGTQTIELLLASVSLNHSQIYTCSAYNNIGGTKTRSLFLTVKEKTPQKARGESSSASIVGPIVGCSILAIVVLVAIIVFVAIRKKRHIVQPQTKRTDDLQLGEIKSNANRGRTDTLNGNEGTSKEEENSNEQREYSYIGTENEGEGTHVYSEPTNDYVNETLSITAAGAMFVRTNIDLKQDVKKVLTLQGEQTNESVYVNSMQPEYESLMGTSRKETDTYSKLGTN